MFPVIEAFGHMKQAAELYLFSEKRAVLLPGKAGFWLIQRWCVLLECKVAQGQQ